MKYTFPGPQQLRMLLLYLLLATGAQDLMFPIDFDHHPLHTPYYTVIVDVDIIVILLPTL